MDTLSINVYISIRTFKVSSFSLYGYTRVYLTRPILFENVYCSQVFTSLNIASLLGVFLCSPSLPPLALWEADRYGLSSWSALCPLILAGLALALLGGMFLPVRGLQITCVSRLKVIMFL